MLLGPGKKKNSGHGKLQKYPGISLTRMNINPELAAMVEKQTQVHNSINVNNVLSHVCQDYVHSRSPDSFSLKHNQLSL